MSSDLWTVRYDGEVYRLGMDTSDDFPEQVREFIRSSVMDNFSFPNAPASQQIIDGAFVDKPQADASRLIEGSHEPHA